MIKHMLINFLYKLIELIEKYQYRNEIWNENNEKLKIQQSFNITNLKVLSDTGFENILNVHRTQGYKIWNIETKKYKLSGADNHIIFNENLEEINIKDVNLEQKIITKNGIEKIEIVNNMNSKISMYDLSVNNSHRYFTNGILSHNTVCTSIFMLWYLTFFNDKTIMIVANKGATTTEILNKVRDIYKNMPFFIKPGILTLNTSALKFDTDSRIATQGRSKEPAIGFTIDILYMDEFAHIPENILEPYYENAFPTLSSLKDSKIIITSTPKGQNLFYKLLTSAELPEGHPNKNTYNSMRVYWWQIPGRDTIWIDPNFFKLKEIGSTDVEFMNFLVEENGFFFIKTEEIVNAAGMPIIRWHFKHPELNYEDIEIISEIQYKNIDLNKICLVSSWKNQEVNNFGGGQEGIEKFGQQYDLLFVVGSRMLFGAETMGMIHKYKREFKHIPDTLVSKKVIFTVKELKWILDPEIFDINKAKDYHIIISVDLAEGLGKDYSVINIFKLTPFSEEEIIKSNTHNNYYDLFRLEQIGIYDSNLNSLDEVAEVCYLLAFEIFDGDKVKMVIEMNMKGGEFISKMQTAQGGNNNFGSFVIVRYKHAHNAKITQMGLKLNSQNKKIFIKDFQKSVEKQRIKIFEENTITELASFVKHETRNGDVTYRCDKGHDDRVMTLVNMSTVFHTIEYKSLVDDMLKNLDSKFRKLIESKNFNGDNLEVANYDSIYKNKENTKEDWKLQEINEGFELLKQLNIKTEDKYIDFDEDNDSGHSLKDYLYGTGWTNNIED